MLALAPAHVTAQAAQATATIHGQEKFVASKGFLVQVPKRLIYSMETVGDRPSLRFEVTNPDAHVMHPADETPVPIPGVRYEKAAVVAAMGQNEFLIGDQPIFVANQGDVVYAPAQTWHRPRHVGNGFATRMTIAGYANSHVYSATGTGTE